MTRVVARAALLVAVAVACRAQPDPNAHEQITADDLEALAAGHPDCVLPPPPSSSVVQRWQVESLHGTVSLPPRYRFAPTEEARVRWVDADSSVLELHGTAALRGLAATGDLGEPVPETPCALRFLGRRASTPRTLLLRANGTDSVFLGAPGMAGPHGGGVRALIFARSAMARDELLAALTTLQLDP